MKFPNALLVALCGVAVSFGARAEYIGEPDCSEPTKPYEFTSQWEVDSFKRDVETYKQCIEDFVDEQNDAVRRHRAAAGEAIDQWNRFVARELR